MWKMYLCTCAFIVSLVDNRRLAFYLRPACSRWKQLSLNKKNNA
jgi:hypothetical protein